MTERLRILQGDVLEKLAELEDGSVQCVVTSPPYFALRSYLDANSPDKARELGSEAALDCLGWATGSRCGSCWCCHMVAVFAEVKRVLRDDGTVWLNIGDSYVSSPAGKPSEKYVVDVPQGGTDGVYSRRWHSNHQGCLEGEDARRSTYKAMAAAIPPKNLCLQPARLALALQSDGWWIRSNIVWAKTNPMPESVTDRPTSAHETIWLMSKSERYFYDQEAVREPGGNHSRPSLKNGKYQTNGTGLSPHTGLNSSDYTDTGRNLRNVWHLSTEPYPEAHFATFPTAIPKRAILAGTSQAGACPTCGAPWRRVVEMRKSWREDAETREQAYPNGSGNRCVRHSNGGMSQSVYEQTGWQPSCPHPHTEADTVPCVVLDCFAGSFTSGLVALRLGRHFIGIELNPEYVELGKKRMEAALAQETLALA